MVVASLTILFQLLPEDQSEFRVLPVIQYLDNVFESEVQATRHYFETKNEIDGQKLILTSKLFNKAADSLLAVSQSPAIQEIVNNSVISHRKYENFIQREKINIENNHAYNALTALQIKQPLIDSVKMQIGILNQTYLPLLNNALKKYNQKMSIAVTTGSIILFLALAIGSVFAFLLARALTKPIQALQAGTQRVGEGSYETVVVSSNDEIADLTRAFNMMSDKLKQLDEMRMEMMSEISHEMRTPLQVIKAGCYSIIHAKDGPQLTQRQRDAVGMIHQATNRINSFVNSFLDIAKMEAGLMKFNFEKINIVDLLTPLIQEAQLIAQTRQINLIFNAVEVPQFMIDKERMSQAFSNLLSNALKYTPDSGSIIVNITETDRTVASKTGKGAIKIEVQDTGVGIPEADLGKLFNKFYQAKNVPLVNEKGSGLGLALVKHVTEAHGGKVSVKSQVGLGSLFTIILPINE
jgi:two-component system sensor histidine kinase GlrK